MSDLTVIIPTFARQQQTLDAIASVVAQQVNARIIVVDDASPQPFALPAALALERGVRLIRRDKNGGAAAARNTGIAAANTKLITFLDSDDTLLPNTLRKRMEYADARMEGSVSQSLLTIGCGWVEILYRQKSRRVRIPLPSRSADDFFGGCWVCPGSAVIFSRDLFDRVGGYDESLRRLEDVDLFIRIGLAGGMFEPHNIAGASVLRSPEKSSVDVISAAALLLRKHTGLSDESPLGLKRLDRLRAYVELELASNARRSGNHVSMLAHLARSFMAQPRSKLQLVPGWRYADIGASA